MVSNGSTQGQHQMNNLFASYGPNNEVFNQNQNFNLYQAVNNHHMTNNLVTNDENMIEACP